MKRTKVQTCATQAMKRRKVHSSLFQSMKQIDDNILIMIIVRCPASSISRFRCVSKRWDDIILTPFIHQCYHQLRKERGLKMVGYVQEHYPVLTDDEDFPPSTRILQVPRGPNTIKFTDNTENYFVNSSNGLILYKVTTNRPTICSHYLIVNPVTGKRKKLIGPGFLSSAALALVCEDKPLGLVPNYKVVVAEMEIHSCLSVTTYCSKTRWWITSTPTATGNLHDKLQRCSSSPFVVDGIIHWFTHNRKQLVVYYMENDTIQLVELPSDCLASYGLKVARSSRDDDLWLCMHMPDSCSIKIWKLLREQYDGYRSQSITIPSHAWISTHTPLAPTPTTTPLASEWSMQGFQHKVPYVAFAMATGTYLCIWILTDSSSQYFKYYPPEDHMEALHGSPLIKFRCYFSPYMEALSLSSYAL